MSEKQVACPFCSTAKKSVAMQTVTINHFPHRRSLKAKKCPRCGFMALFDMQKIAVVPVGGRVVTETASFGR